MPLDVQSVFYCLKPSENQKRLFEEALRSARNGKVLYILQEELNELPELSQDLSSINLHYMKMISFLYVKSIEALIESVSTLPDWQNIPCTLILEDLIGFCGNNLQNACGVVAMLTDAMRSCSKTLKVCGTLCISINKGSISDEFCNTVVELYHISTYSKEKKGN